LGTEADAVEFLESLKPTASIQMRKGDVYSNLGKHLEAIGEYRKVVDSFPQSPLVPAALYKIGTAYMNLNEHQAALSQFERLLRDHPSSDWVDEAELRIAETHIENGDYRRAIVRLENFSSQSAANSSMALLHLGAAYDHAGETYKAKEVLLSVVESYPDEPARDRANLELGKIYLEEDAYSVALSRFRDVIRNRTDEIACEAQLLIGDAHFKKEEFEIALVEYERVEYIYGFCTERIPEALLGAAGCNERLENYDRAREIYKSVIQRFPGSSEAYEAETRLERIKWK
jgi:TolA-binding protein